jgi:hypothetical protein
MDKRTFTARDFIVATYRRDGRWWVEVQLPCDDDGYLPHFLAQSEERILGQSLFGGSWGTPVGLKRYLRKDFDTQEEAQQTADHILEALELLLEAGRRAGKVVD